MSSMPKTKVIVDLNEAEIKTLNKEGTVIPSTRLLLWKCVEEPKLTKDLLIRKIISQTVEEPQQKPEAEEGWFKAEDLDISDAGFHVFRRKRDAQQVMGYLREIHLSCQGLVLRKVAVKDIILIGLSRIGNAMIDGRPCLTCEQIKILEEANRK